MMACFVLCVFFCSLLFSSKEMASCGGFSTGKLSGLFLVCFFYISLGVFFLRDQSNEYSNRFG